VLSVIRVKDYEEAITAANASDYGLTSSIYTNDAGRIFDFCERIQTGMVHVNSPTVGGEAQIPFGGMKSSGVGEREQGPTALDFYTDVKVVYYRLHRRCPDQQVLLRVANLLTGLVSDPWPVASLQRLSPS
jgi:aldehyde dehydrogenase (NAD+)